MPESASEPTLRRVLALSLMDGWCMSLFSGFCTLGSLLTGEWAGAAVGGIVMSCGLTTLRNRRRLLRGEAGGMEWLLRAQLVVIGVVFLFVVQCLLAFDPVALKHGLDSLETNSLIGGLLLNQLAQYGLSITDLHPLLKPVYVGFYLLVMGCTLLFQGGLAFFYLTRRALVRAELAGRVGEGL